MLRSSHKYINLQYDSTINVNRIYTSQSKQVLMNRPSSTELVKYWTDIFYLKSGYLAFKHLIQMPLIYGASGNDFYIVMMTANEWRYTYHNDINALANADAKRQLTSWKELSKEQLFRLLIEDKSLLFIFPCFSLPVSLYVNSMFSSCSTPCLLHFQVSFFQFLKVIETNKIFSRCIIVVHNISC